MGPGQSPLGIPFNLPVGSVTGGGGAARTMTSELARLPPVPDDLARARGLPAPRGHTHETPGFVGHGQRLLARPVRFQRESHRAECRIGRRTHVAEKPQGSRLGCGVLTTCSARSSLAHAGAEAPIARIHASKRRACGFLGALGRCRPTCRRALVRDGPAIFSPRRGRSARTRAACGTPPGSTSRDGGGHTKSM